MTAPNQRPKLLLVEPQSLMRRTVAAAARDTGLADVQEAASIEAAKRLLDVTSFDAVVIDLDRDGSAIDLVTRLREGRSRCDRAVPIVAIADACDAPTVMRLREFKVRRVLLKPFKVQSVLDSLLSVWPERQPLAFPRAVA